MTYGYLFRFDITMQDKGGTLTIPEEGKKIHTSLNMSSASLLDDDQEENDQMLDY